MEKIIKKPKQEIPPRSKYLDYLQDKPFEIIEKYKEKIDFNTDEFLSCLKDKIDSGTEIGTGQCADVFIFSPEDGFGDVCIKKIKEYPEVKINDIDIEVKFQKQVLEAGIRAPKLLFQIKHGNEKYIAMERIKGFSLKQAIELEPGTDHFSQVNNFQIDEFFSKLKNSIEKMHTEAIYHRDLHGGNVMVEYETGEPVIIDFGSAGMFFGGEEESDIYIETAQKLTNSEQVRMGREKGIYSRGQGQLLNDNKQVDELKRKTKEFLNG